MPWRSGSGGESGSPTTFRPWMWIKFWSFGHFDWYSYEGTSAPFWFSMSIEGLHFGSLRGASRESGSV